MDPNGPDADIPASYAKTEPDAGPRGITACLIVTGLATVQKLGMRGSDTCELVFQGCEVPAENVFGWENEACAC